MVETNEVWEVETDERNLQITDKEKAGVFEFELPITALTSSSSSQSYPTSAANVEHDIVEVASDRELKHSSTISDTTQSKPCEGHSVLTSETCRSSPSISWDNFSEKVQNGENLDNSSGERSVEQSSSSTQLITSTPARWSFLKWADQLSDSFWSCLYDQSTESPPGTDFHSTASPNFYLPKADENSTWWMSACLTNPCLIDQSETLSPFPCASCLPCGLRSSKIRNGAASLRHEEVEQTKRMLERDIARLLGETSREAVRCLQSLQGFCTDIECFQGERDARAPRLLLGNNVVELSVLDNVAELFRHRISAGKNAQALKLESMRLRTNCFVDYRINSPLVASTSCDEDKVEMHNGRRFNRNPRRRSLLAYREDDAQSCGSNHTAQSLFYDSDPGECVLRHRGNPRKAQQFPFSSIRIEKPGEREGADGQDWMDKSTPFDAHYDSLVTTSINHLTNSTVLLVWHPGQSTVGSEQIRVEQEGAVHQQKPLYVSARSPRCVRAWIERGSRLKDNKVLHPKFMWMETQRQMSASEGRHSRARFVKPSKAPHALDMLGITRVLKPMQLDRALYPIAKVRKSFTITSYTGKTFLFEAPTEVECDKVVNSLKLSVARLTSKIMLGATDVLEEFYAPWSPATVLPTRGYCHDVVTQQADSATSAARSMSNAADESNSDHFQEGYYPKYEGVKLWGN